MSKKFRVGLLGAILAILCCHSLFVLSAEAQTWNYTGSMVGARDNHTATLLPNGKVLVTGGWGGDSSAELFTPATGTFSSTGSMNFGRNSHTATLLPNGKVLIAGGGVPESELYDPETGTFSLTGSMPYSRAGCTATLLPNGKVLIAGGRLGPPWNDFTASAELYDPSTGTFSYTGGMGTAREEHSATLLPDGTVLIAGGLTKGTLWEETTDTAEVYDPVAGTFSPASTLNDSRALHTATLLPDGKVLIAAGYTKYALVYLNTAEIYNPSTKTFSYTGSLATGRMLHTANLLSNGTVLIAGGTYGTTNPLQSAELYDPVTGSFGSTAAMNTKREAHTATLLPDGRVLVAGGRSYPSPAQSSAELYSLPDTGGAFSPTGLLSTDRGAFTATRLYDGKVLVVGGYTGTGVFLSSAEVYAPNHGGFSPTGGMSTERSGHTATLLANGKVLVTGGGAGTSLASAELYDPTSGTFGLTGNMGVARNWHTATLLANGKVLIVGGYDGTYLASAELYDPATGNFNPTGEMTTARAGHTATLLANGEVLIAGGIVSGGWYSATAELYDPVAGTFSSTGPMGTKRAEHTATLLRNDKVLIAGGYGQVGSGPLDPLATAELYDPATGTFTPTGSMLSAREYPTATALLNGKVLIAGGTMDLYSQPTLASAELYDPETEAFYDVGSMGLARVRHAATPLADGRVLIAGGYGWGNYLFFSELFQAADPIPVDWVTNPANGHLYKAVECGSWWDCEGQAVAEGGHLVSVNDVGEQNWLTLTFGGKYLYWIGLNDETTEGIFVWSSAEPVTYTNWAPGEPNDWGGAEDYAIMNWSAPGLWNDAYLYSMAVTMGIIERWQLPDLVEFSMTNPPAYAASGSSFTVTDTAKNQGTAASSVSSTTQFYLSLDAVKGSGDILLDGVRTVPPLAAGSASGPTATAVTIPSGTPSGAYYLIACVDDFGNVLESNEGNNCLASATTVSVCVAPGYISVTPWEGFDSSGPQGGPFSPSSTTYTLTNPGGCPLDWTASKGQAWVSLSKTGGTLASGASTDIIVSINSTANALPPGTHGDEVYFTNTTNGNGNTTKEVNLTVNPASPEIILDNAPAGQSGGGRSYTGTWAKSGASGAYGADSLYSNGAGTDTYRWTPTIPAAGDYDVYVRWTAYSTRSTSVPIAVTHAGGTTTKTYDQQSGGGVWVLHGTYGFNAGTGGYVQVSDVNGQACADAVRFVPAAALPTVTVAATDPNAAENPVDTGVFTVSRTGSTAAALTVGYTVGGTATSGSDYTALSGNVTIPIGSPTATVTVTPVNDTQVEGDETVVLTLSAGAGYAVGTPGSATVTIASDDVGEIILDNAPAGQSGGGRSYTGTWLKSSAAGYYGVDSLYSNGSGVDTYRWTPTIPAAGNYDVYVRWTAYSTRSSSVPIAVNHTGGKTTVSYNQKVDGGKWVLHGTYGFNAGTGGYVEVAESAATGQQACADAVRFVPAAALPMVTVAATDPNAVENPLDTGVFTISRTGSTAAALSVGYTVGGTATSGSDYTALSGSVTIPIGSATATVTVTPVNDTQVEGDETVVLTLSAGAGYAVGTPGSATVTIASDDVGEIILDNAPAGQSGGGRSYTGTWAKSSASGAYGADSLYSNGSGVDTYRWTPTIPAAGTYEVYVRWTAYSTRSSSVPIAVNHAGGKMTKSYDQRSGGGVWVLHGTYGFNAGTGGYVEVAESAATGQQACADAVRFVPAAAPPTEIILDNALAGQSGGGRSFTGSWCKSTTSGFYGTDSLYSCGSDSTYRWTPTIPAAGNYEVYVWWTAHANRSSSVPITVNHTGGPTTNFYDQKVDGGKWVLHGTYSFSAGTGGFVEAWGGLYTTGRQACADAVKFVPAP